jgi:hypothetical protein
MGDLLLGNRIRAKTAGVNAELAAPEELDRHGR